MTVPAHETSRRFGEHQRAVWRSLYEAARTATPFTARLHVDEIDGALVTSAPSVDVPTFNRVLGIGTRRAATHQLIDALIAWYREVGARCFSVEIGPDSAPEQIGQWLTDRGFVLSHEKAVLSRSTQVVPRSDSSLQIRAIGLAEAHSFAKIVESGFGWPKIAGQIAASAVGRGGWQHYLAYDGATPVGAGAFYSAGHLAWLGFGCTIGSYRRLGGQSARTARMIQDAAENCHTAFADTGVGSISYRNLQRLGFEHLCSRAMYTYTFASEGRVLGQVRQAVRAVRVALSATPLSARRRNSGARRSPSASSRSNR